MKPPSKETEPGRTDQQDKDGDKVKDKDRKKKTKKKKKKGLQVDPPSTELILKYPIEVWVSSGENFIKPESKCNGHESL